MPRVVLESPYSGDAARHIAYAHRCLHDSLLRGESPLMSHLLYTQVLNDTIPVERDLGMAAGHHWITVANLLVVYSDLGISAGMKLGIATAQKHNIPVLYRKLDK